MSGKVINLIKVIALDLVGVLVKENDFVLDKTDEKLERLFGKNRSDFEFSSKATEIVPSLDTNTLKERCKYILSSIYSLKITLGELSKFKEQHKDIKLVVATNHISCVKEFILKAFGQNLFDEMFISSELDTVKPEAEFYTKIMEQLNVKPEAICVVDDTLENIAGANNVGIVNTIHISKTSNTLALIESMLDKNT